MKKETLIKLLLLFGIDSTTIRYCTHLHVTVEDVEAMQHFILAEKDGRLDL